MPITGEELIKKTDTFIEKTDTLVGEMSSLLKKVTTSENKKQQEETNAKRQIARDAFSKKKDYLEDVNKGVLKTNDILMQLLRKPGDRDKGGGLFGGLGDMIGGLLSNPVVLGGLAAALGAGVLASLTNEKFRDFLGKHLVDPLVSGIGSVIKSIPDLLKKGAEAFNEPNKNMKRTLDIGASLGKQVETQALDVYSKKMLPEEARILAETKGMMPELEGEISAYDKASTGGFFGRDIFNKETYFPISAIKNLKLRKVVVQKLKEAGINPMSVFAPDVLQILKNIRFEYENSIKELEKQARENPITPVNANVIGNPYSVLGISDEYKDYIVKAAKENNIDPDQLAAIIGRESTGNPNALSPKGASGLGQLLPGTAKDTAESMGMKWSPDMINDPETNVKLSANYFAKLLKQFDENFELALAAYNAGPANAKKAYEAYKSKSGKWAEPSAYIPAVENNYQKIQEAKLNNPNNALPSESQTIKINDDIPVSTSIDDKTIEKWMVGFKKVLESSSKSDRSTVVNLAGTKK